MSALLVYASDHGHTARIADRVRRTLEDGGLAVDVRDAGQLGEVAPGGYDLVVVGASVHAGHHQKPIVAWAARHARALGAVPSAFFSVSLTPADDTEEAWATARAFVEAFVAETGWTPRCTATFAGALQYREYGIALRWLMRRMMRRGGHPTDTSRDYDYTDWAAVERFGRDCAALVELPRDGSGEGGIRTLERG